MKTMWEKTCQLLAFILIVFSVVLGITTLASAVEYEYTELLPPGAIGSSASVINNSGAVVVVGDYDNGLNKLFIYSEGVYTELPPLGWGLSEVSAINDINDSGAVVGEVYDGTTTAGFLYSEGVYTKMLPQGWGLSEAHGINNSGVVVGYGNDVYGTKNWFLYSAGQYTELLPLGWTFSYPSDINNSGVVVGYGNDSTTADFRGFIYSAGVYTELLPSGAVKSSANAINNSGAVVGEGNAEGASSKGFLYSAGVYTEIMPPGTVLSYAKDINDSGAVVGAGAEEGASSKGFLYSAGVYTEIMPPGWVSTVAYGINNSGVVVGTGHDGTSDKGFIAIPITTPLEQMQSLIEFFDNGVADGSLSGNGLFSKLKLKRFRGMLLQAQALIESGNTDGACQLLTKAYMRVDGNTLPRDYVMGSAAPNLAAKIDALIKSLNCS